MVHVPNSSVLSLLVSKVAKMRAKMAPSMFRVNIKTEAYLRRTCDPLGALQLSLEVLELFEFVVDKEAQTSFFHSRRTILHALLLKISTVLIEARFNFGPTFIFHNQKRGVFCGQIH
jgi:hypothetical protein